MNPINWVQALQGPALVAVICGLMFVEETGVPLPFAPGDVILAIGGIAVAGGRVNPVMLVAAVAVTITLGAIVGREAAALLGWERLMRIAEPLRARGALERAAGLLQRGGWRAVFTARLIPGLRIYTTQVAGVSRVPLRTFVGGLVPANAVYIAAFVGLGAAVGRPILALIRLAERQLLIALLVLVALVALFFLTRTPIRRTLTSLQAAGWTGPLTFRLDSVSVVLILSSLGLNFAGRAIAVTFGLPLFLDSIGTVLAGVIGGPWLGGSVGFISNLVNSNTVDPIAAPYALVSFAVGFAAGLARYLNWQKRASGWVALWLTTVAIASLVSTPLNFLMGGGKPGVWLGDSIYGALNGAHLPRIVAAFVGEAAVDLPDKLLTTIVALLIAQGLPQRRIVPRSVDLDLGQAFTFVIRSDRWVRKLLAGAACLLLFWLIVPVFILLGYVVHIARRVRAGARELPSWNHPWQNTRDGFKLLAALLIWTIPSVLLSIPAAVVSAVPEGTPGTLGTLSELAGIVGAGGSVWGLMVLLAEPAIISQYLDRGFRGALNVRAVTRRVRVNLALSIVVGALVVVLTTIGLIGLGAIVIGVLVTLPYASFTGGYLVGQYARLTEQPELGAEAVNRGGVR
ncbi:MAG: energy-coupling factor transport system substrate-specific component [Chloroflexota bacterium]|nr:energy-coupling factor transport system substrate-specific component [Chloroflexota bacterium]